jgi:hypothetical protein
LVVFGIAVYLIKLGSAASAAECYQNQRKAFEQNNQAQFNHSNKRKKGAYDDYDKENGLTPTSSVPALSVVDQLLGGNNNNPALRKAIKQEIATLLFDDNFALLVDLVGELAKEARGSLHMHS